MKASNIMLQSTATAAAEYYGTLTYKLGRSLYVPLTCRSNSRTLPELRGERFLLPSQVVAALCRVRDKEMGTSQWVGWCNYLESTDGLFQLPPRSPITPNDSPFTTTMTQQQQQEPSIEDLFQEVQEYCSMIVTEQGNHAVNDNFSMLDSIVFSGEGEPSCRWDDLIELTSMFHNDPTIQRAVKSRNDGGEPSPSLRLTTNGLIDVKNMAMTTAYVPSPSSSVPQFLFDSGITHVSVALMTHDPELYDELVQPSFLNGAKPHSMVCKFIQESVQVPGLDVEVTGVDRQGIVDKSKTEALAASLGVTNPMRWRPYFS